MDPLLGQCLQGTHGCVLEFLGNFREDNDAVLLLGTHRLCKEEKPVAVFPGESLDFQSHRRLGENACLNS